MDLIRRKLHHYIPYSVFHEQVLGLSTAVYLWIHLYVRFV